VHACGIYLRHSSDNVIFHNNFVNNTEQVRLDESSDIWDNGCERNCWSDYNGTDYNGDGIGDTLLPHQGVDYYPLMNPYIEGDVNHDAIVNILDGVVIAVAFGSRSGDQKWNPMADIVADNVINIQDILLWAIYFGETL